MNGGGRIIHDPFDRVRAATALGAASEAGIDLAHAGPSRLLCDHRPHLVVAEHIARTDNHFAPPEASRKSDADIAKDRWALAAGLNRRGQAFLHFGTSGGFHSLSRKVK